MVQTNQGKNGLAALGVVVAVLAMIATLLGAAPTAASSGLASEGVVSTDRLGDALDFSNADVQPFAATVNGNGMIDIEVLTADTGEVADELRALGATVNGSQDGAAVHVEATPEMISQIEAINGVDGVLPALQVVNARGSVVGEEVAHIGAPTWHAAGATGKGVRVLLVDQFGKAIWDRARASKDVPKPSGTFCSVRGRDCSVWDVVNPNEPHGTAVAEMVHELAPNAKIYLATQGTTVDLPRIVDYAISNKIDIISMSQVLTGFDTPGNGTGTWNAAAAKAADNGIAFFASSGNRGGVPGATTAQERGVYYRGPFTDTNNDGIHEFVPGGDELMGYQTCNGQISARWNDFDSTGTEFGFTASNATDYELIVVDNLDQTPLPIKYRSTERQGSPGQLPIEFAPGDDCRSGQVDFVAVRMVSPGNGTQGDIIEIMAANGQFEYYQNPYSAAIPIVDSKRAGIFGVGAVDPVGGNQIATYSSQGPTTDGRMTPKISGAACVETTAYGPNQCFNGTSAGAPSVAGFAALVLSSGLAKNPAQLEAFLASNAIDRGPRGADSIFGHGEAIAISAPCGGRLATKVGTNGKDTLKGTKKADVIAGLGGNDKIIGKGGNDILCGNGGNDTLIGGGGKDTCYSNALGLKKDKGKYKKCKKKK